MNMSSEKPESKQESEEFVFEQSRFILNLTASSDVVSREFFVPGKSDSMRNDDTAAAANDEFNSAKALSFVDPAFELQQCRSEGPQAIAVVQTETHRRARRRHSFGSGNNRGLERLESCTSMDDSAIVYDTKQHQEDFEKKTLQINKSGMLLRQTIGAIQQKVKTSYLRPSGQKSKMNMERLASTNSCMDAEVIEDKFDSVTEIMSDHFSFSSLLEKPNHHEPPPSASPRSGKTMLLELQSLAGAARDEALEEKAKVFRNIVEIKDRRYHLKVYNGCFIGSEAVDAMVDTGMVSSREEALAVGRMLQKELDLFHHVTNDHMFDDKYLFFRLQEKEEEDEGAVTLKNVDKILSKIKASRAEEEKKMQQEQEAEKAIEEEVDKETPQVVQRRGPAAAATSRDRLAGHRFSATRPPGRRSTRQSREHSPRRPSTARQTHPTPLGLSKLYSEKSASGTMASDEILFQDSGPKETPSCRTTSDVSFHDAALCSLALEAFCRKEGEAYDGETSQSESGRPRSLSPGEAKSTMAQQQKDELSRSERTRPRWNRRSLSPGAKLRSSIARTNDRLSLSEKTVARRQDQLSQSEHRRPQSNRQSFFPGAKLRSVARPNTRLSLSEKTMGKTQDQLSQSEHRRSLSPGPKRPNDRLSVNEKNMAKTQDQLSQSERTRPRSNRRSLSPGAKLRSSIARPNDRSFLSEKSVARRHDQLSQSEHRRPRSNRRSFAPGTKLRSPVARPNDRLSLSERTMAKRQDQLSQSEHRRPRSSRRSLSPGSKLRSSIAGQKDQLSKSLSPGSKLGTSRRSKEESSRREHRGSVTRNRETRKRRSLSTEAKLKLESSKESAHENQISSLQERLRQIKHKKDELANNRHGKSRTMSNIEVSSSYDGNDRRSRSPIRARSLNHDPLPATLVSDSTKIVSTSVAQTALQEELAQLRAEVEAREKADSVLRDEIKVLREELAGKRRSSSASKNTGWKNQVK